MKARRIICIALVAVSVTAFVSCSDAIYATIETAIKTSTNTLSLLLTVTDIVVPPPGGTYYVSAGAVFLGTLVNGTVTWTPNVNDNTRPLNPSGYVCNALTQFSVDGRLYGGFVTGPGAVALYRSDTSLSFNGTHGTLITSTVSPGEQVTYLKSANGILFMGGATFPTGATQYVYELDYSADGTTWNPAIASPLAYPVSGVGYDFVHTVYWASSGSNLYKGSSPSTLALVGNPSGADPILGLFVDSANGRVFLTMKTSGIYFSSDGATWAHIGADLNGSAQMAYLCAAGPVDPGNNIYLVGADGFGYYTLNFGAGSWSRFGDTTILLYTSSVSRIVFDGPNSNVLMGTNLNGLWRGVFDSTGALASGQSWTHE
jgi:hypothetical protein